MASRVETEFARNAILENLDYFQKRFLGRENGQQFNFPPRIIDVHLGYKGQPCQNKCVWCYDRLDKNPRLIRKYGQEQVAEFSSKLDRAIDWQTSGFKIEEVYLAGGGEPTLFPEVARLIIERFATADRNAWLTTNGINIKEPLFSSLIRNAKGLLVSLVGTDTESYKRGAQYNGFEKVMQTLGDVLRTRRLIESPLRVNVTHVFNRASLPRLESLILRLNDMGVDEFRCRYDLFSNPSDPQNVAGKEILLRVAQKYPDMKMQVMLKSPPDEILPGNYECYASFVWPTWNPLHGVYPCAHITDERNRIESNQANGVYSLVDITEQPGEVVKQNCHRRCPSRIHWFNLFLNDHDLGISDIPQASILVK